MTPIVCAWPRLPSAGTYPRPRPIVSVISRRPFDERFAISRSGLRISRSAGASMSTAVTTPSPRFVRRTSTSGDSPWRMQTSCFRLRMMSVTSSRTPGSVVNSCATPSIFTEVTGAPVVIRLQPRGDSGGQVGRVADDLLRARPGLQRDDVVGLDLVARDVDAAAVHGKVTVPHELARLRA